MSTGDPITVALLATAIGGLALVASFVPAARMGRMDPVRALRE